MIRSSLVSWFGELFRGHESPVVEKSDAELAVEAAVKNHHEVSEKVRGILSAQSLLPINGAIEGIHDDREKSDVR